MPLPPFIPSKTRVRRRRETVIASPTPALQRILWVRNDGDPTAFDAQLTGSLASLVDAPATLELSVDGATWVGVEQAAIDDSDHAHVFLSFADDMSDATLWRVSAPANWVFKDGTLGEPMSGTIG